VIIFPRRDGHARDFHQARWNEQLVFDLGSPGERGVLPPPSEPATAAAGGPVRRGLRNRRRVPPRLPEISQPQVLRHYLRLSQETLGADLNIDIGQGTCTMKYSPKVNDTFVRSPEVSGVHPLQPVDTVQGLLELFHRLERMIAEISGLHSVTLQPGAGSAAIYANISMVRKFHAVRGESYRDEVITTGFSHPSNAATAKTAGYQIITLPAGPDGYPTVEALRAAVTDRCAALMITNPEDIGVFNPHIADFVRIVHEAGGLCVYDQANANGILGITRAADAGFDLCHFNLHKTFSTPHACGGPAAGACAVTEELAPYLPTPVIVRAANGRFELDHDRPLSIGKVRPFYGVTANLVRAYAWISSLGAQGLRQVAETAVLNNNYLLMKITGIDGIAAPYAARRHRIEQVRYSLAGLHEETGVSSGEFGVRLGDFGLHYWTSHHPYTVPEPATIEPTESYSRAELDEYVAAMRAVAAEARTDPEKVLSAPHRGPIHHSDPHAMDDPETWAVTYRAYRRKFLGEPAPEVPRWTPPPGVPAKHRPPRAAHR
jgi:glycine dehydrogenase subunit 2